jgi:hypothetical protein
MVLAKPPCNSRAPIFSLSNAPDRVRRGCTEDLRGQVGVGWRQRVLEVAQRLALPLVSAAVDLEFEDAPAPPFSDRNLRVPVPYLGGLDALEQADHMAPRQK